MAWFTTPTALRLREPSLFYNVDNMSPATNTTALFLQSVAVEVLKHKEKSEPHSQHPPLANLLLLVFEAVLEVVCVSLPGYIIARQGMFDAGNQKFVANLNVSLFTPCLIFTKLASQLTVDKLADLAVIPIIFTVMTAVSYIGSLLVAKAFKFRRRARNFVIAMGVFGNSNSLPISLVLSLAFTLKGLHWDKIPGDNDNDVAARGILYLLIFQQLGQLVRWSWGYHVLLAPPSTYTVEDGGTMDEDDQFLDEPDRYTDEPPPLVSHTSSIDSDSEWEADIETGQRPKKQSDPFSRPGFPEYEGLGTPIRERSQFIGRPINGLSRQGTLRAQPDRLNSSPKVKQQGVTPQLNSVSETLEQNQAEINANNESTVVASGSGSGASSPTRSRPGTSPNGDLNRNSRVITSFPEPTDSDDESPSSSKANLLAKKVPELKNKVSQNLGQIKQALPEPPKWTKKSAGFIKRFFLGLWEFMNPPLWAMLVAILVASVPALQKIFFTPGSFIENSVTRAVKQSGNVAVPLILVVLGANLAGNTLPKREEEDFQGGKATARHERKILIAALISRMLIPTLIVAPLLAVTAKFVPVSILDDPIFIIVCFLLTGAPSALQLSQICQLNGVYEAVMAKILFWSYVVIILPSTLILVICGLEVVEWADR